MTTENTQNELNPDDIEMDTVIAVVQEVAAKSIVKNHVIASLTLGLVPVPLFDLAALTATQMNMLRSLSEHYGVEFDDTNSKSLITSLIGGSLPVLGVVGLSSLVKAIPGVGSLVGSASLSITAGAVTYAVGQVFIMHFEEGGTFEDFDAKRARDFFKRELEAGKLFVQALKEEIKQAKEAPEETTQDNATEKKS